MIIDFSVTNFRSFQAEQVFSMNVENTKNSLRGNFTEFEGGKFSVLKSAAIFGPNASGKSNLLKAFEALVALISKSKPLDEGRDIPEYQPFKLSASNKGKPVEFSIEFIVPSGIRYIYSVAYNKSKIISESLYSYPKRQKALIFSRDSEDTWESVKFGASYKGGDRRFSFFPNKTYISRAGNDASAPKLIREVVLYFRAIPIIDAGVNLQVSNYFKQDGHLEAISNLICLADTGVSKITAEKNDIELQLPDGFPDKLKKALREEHSVSYKFWHNDQDGQPVKFERDEISDGTARLFSILPVLMTAISNGSPIFVDELDGHLHTNLVALVFELFHDSLVNPKNAQIIVTTHDTNLMDSSKFRRDQFWLVEKDNGSSQLTCLDDFDKNIVRGSSPFEDFYRDGRLGGLPTVSFLKIRDAIRDMPQHRGIIRDSEADA